jgi:hypothetical protein
VRNTRFHLKHYFLKTEEIMRKWLYLGAALVSVGLVAGLAYSVVTDNNDPKAKAAAEPKLVASRVAKVVAYPNSALITREVDVPGGTGTIEIVVSQLPVRIMKDTLYCEGSNGLRVLSTRFRSRPVFEDTREEVRKLEDDKKKLELAAEKLKSEISSIKLNMKTLDGLEKFTTVTTVSSTEKGGINGDTAIAMVKYVMEQRAERMKELVNLEQQLKFNDEQAAFIRLKHKDLTKGSTKEDRDAVITVDREVGNGGKIRLNYLVDAVQWSPQYKLRAGKVGDTVQVDYMASMFQQSGEDWNGVELTLSTAQPLLNAAPPDLGRLEVSVIPRASLPGGGQPGPGGPVTFNPDQGQGKLAKEAEMFRKKALDEANKQNFKDAGKYLNSAAALDLNCELQKTKEELQAEQIKGLRSTHDEGPSVTYHLANRYSVPSRTDEQVVEVAKFSLQPKYYYKAVPVLSKSVFRLADLVNKSSMVLLPGEAAMYQGNDFVGRMSLPLVAVGEEFTAGFGVDPQLQIQRQLMDKTKTTQGGNQVMKYEYRILINSYKSEKVALQVWDRLPLAHETESVGVSLLKASPELSKDALYLRESRPYNLLRWDLEIDPSMNGEKAMIIAYDFRLELDKQMVINTFFSR